MLITFHKVINVFMQGGCDKIKNAISKQDFVGIKALYYYTHKGYLAKYLDKLKLLLEFWSEFEATRSQTLGFDEVSGKRPLSKDIAFRLSKIRCVARACFRLQLRSP